MYGLMFSTLQSLIVNKICNGNDEKWKEICMKSGINHVEFYNHQYYDENFLDKLVVAACEVLGIEMDKALEAFGDQFFQKTKVSGHSHMLRSLGSNLFGFLVNLDSLHSHLSFTYLEMQAPSFQCDITDDGLLLNYYSHRIGLHPVVTGIVKAVAKDFFSLDIEMKKISYEKLEGVKLCHHYRFEIKVKESSKTDDWLERLQGERTMNYVPAVLQLPGGHNSTNLSVLLDLDSPNSVINPKISHSLSMQPSSSMQQCPFHLEEKIEERSVHSSKGEDDLSDCSGGVEEVDKGDQMASSQTKRDLPLDKSIDFPVSFRHLLPQHMSNSPVMSRATSRRASIFIPTDEWPITMSIFRSSFPFHIIFDSNLVITYMGVSMSRLFPNAIPQQMKLTDLFEVERPAIPSMTYIHIKSRSHNQFVLRASKTAKSDANPLLFRGQMIPTSQRSLFPSILFLGSPRVQGIEELKEHGLFLSDIPIHDVTREMILLHHQLKAEMNSVTQLERMRHLLENEQDRVKKEKERADRLLHAMLPESVALELKEGKGAEATYYSNVTILFSDIEGFTTICNKCHPFQVVNMLNELYTKFDSHIDECNVYKVETIGDAYMVAAGLLSTAEEHAYAVTQFSFHMRDVARTIMRPTDNTSLRIRIGIHSGAVMAGVVGMRMPRYCLFGDTVNLASRMESHGEPGKIHISETTYRELNGKPLKFVCRGEISVKGLERMMITYFVETLGPGEEAFTEYPPCMYNNKSRSHSSTTFDFLHSRRIETRGSFNLFAVKDRNLLKPSPLSESSGRIKEAIDDASSVEQSIVVPTLTTSHSSSKNSSRHKNQVSPTTTPPSDVSTAQKSSDRTDSVSSDSDTGITFQTPIRRRRKKCTIS